MALEMSFMLRIFITVSITLFFDKIYYTIKTIGYVPINQAHNLKVIG